ncbi:hypothetical protein [Weissella cibaria]|uniref:hypothetical protein n=1 Tax=Weissella cibaria TaxID=137591 RepID=UPI0014317D9E|nr:hypothetical protein [Weissella cibaria]
MKYGKHVIVVLAIAVIGTDGALVVFHNGHQEETSSAKIKYHSTEKSASTKQSSTSNKTLSSSVKQQTSTSPDSSLDSAVSSEIASSALPTGNTDTQTDITDTTDTQINQQPAQTDTADTQINQQPAQTNTADTQVTVDSQNDGSNVPYDNGDPNTDIHSFINKYGTTPAGWLVQNKGMSVKDALAATPNNMQTSGEIQDEYMYDQGQDPVQAYQDAQNSGDVQENTDKGTQPSDDNTVWSDATE